jgi:hypothetical protein
MVYFKYDAASNEVSECDLKEYLSQVQYANNVLAWSVSRTEKRWSVLYIFLGQYKNRRVASKSDMFMVQFFEDGNLCAARAMPSYEIGMALFERFVAVVEDHASVEEAVLSLQLSRA